MCSCRCTRNKSTPHLSKTRETSAIVPFAIPSYDSYHSSCFWYSKFAILRTNGNVARLLQFFHSSAEALEFKVLIISCEGNANLGSNKTASLSRHRLSSECPLLPITIFLVKIFFACLQIKQKKKYLNTLFINFFETRYIK